MVQATWQAIGTQCSQPIIRLTCQNSAPATRHHATLPMLHPDTNPCLDCGACCASFRVSFYWSEGEARGLPDELTEQVNAWFSCMAGTNQARPHCVALTGSVGGATSCRVYTQRPSPCREVQAGDSQCAKARAWHGLHALICE